ncbi:MAG: IS21 family transposase [Cyclobacteriaceae bacterium]
MANKRIEMIVLKRIIQLKEKGLSNRKIAVQLGVHRNSVNSYVALLDRQGQSYSKLFQLSDADLDALLPQAVGLPLDARYESLQSQFPMYEKELKKVGCTYQTLWYSYRKGNPSGYSYTQFKHHLQCWQQKQEVSMPMTHKMGDKLFVDYTGKKLSYIDKSTGEVHAVEVFVAILGGSQYTYVVASQSQQSEDFISALNGSLSYYGGVSQAIVCDNLKSAVTKSSKYEPLLNKNMSAFGLHYNTAVLPTRAYKPQDKSLVEGAVKLVYQRIFYPLEGIQFFSLSSLNQAIREKLLLYNQALFQGRDYSRKDLFEKQERAQLQPLADPPFAIKYYKRAKVQKNSHVWLGDDGNYYSVPHLYIGNRVELQYSKTLVEVYYKQERIASHARSKIIGGYTTQKSHMPSTHQYVIGWNAEYFINWGKSKSPLIEKYIERTIKKKAYPEQAYKSCMGLQQLYRQYPQESFEKACQRATEYERFGYLVIKNILEKGLEKIRSEEDQLSSGLVQDHQNIRGNNYYH